jgi:hypothetical protein
MCCKLLLACVEVHFFRFLIACFNCLSFCDHLVSFLVIATITMEISCAQQTNSARVQCKSNACVVVG